jgi:hypothetical protein
MVGRSVIAVSSGWGNVNDVDPVVVVISMVDVLRQWRYEG